MFEIKGDYLDRTVPWCLLRRKGNDTIVLIHHNDIAETKDYGPLEDLCLKPYELMESFKAGKIELPSSAKEDLFSEKWIFGRGVSDMRTEPEFYRKGREYYESTTILSKYKQQHAWRSIS